MSEYVSDVIRQDKEQIERQAFERLKAELARAFAAPDCAHRNVSVDEVIARNKVRGTM